MTEASVRLRVLGTVIEVPAPIATLLPDFEVTDAPAVAAVGEPDLTSALVALTRLAVEHSPLLCIHAAVVSQPDGLLAFPGPSGLGKSTLAWALARAGFGYVSDEALALDRVTARAVPFARPIGIGAVAWDRLGADAGPPPLPGEEKLLPTSLLGRVDTFGGEVRHIILARRNGEPARLTPAAPGEAVTELLTRSFNHFRDPANSLQTVTRVVRASSVWRATYTEATDLADLLRDRLGT